MTYRGRVKNGTVVLDDLVDLPEGAEVRIEIPEAATDGPLVDENGQTLGEKLLTFAGTIKGLPGDLARNHDHYLHGLPKK